MSRPGSVAVVDIGSNSVRLLLAERIGPDGAEGRREMTVTGLRRGSAPDGTVTAAALERLDACLARYAAELAAFGPERVVAAGTAAVRDAPNRADVADVVRRRLGAELRMVSGTEEAALSFAGARLALPAGAGTATVVDIGGGSTELVRGGPGGPERSVSLQLGSSRSTERHLRSDPPGAGELAALRADALTLLGPAVAQVGSEGPVVGVAGTVTQVAAIALGGYDPARIHRMRLDRGTVEDVLARLAALPEAERRGVPGLHPDRVGVIVAGTAILAAVLDALGTAEMMVSERDLLDGVAMAPAPPGQPVT